MVIIVREFHLFDGLTHVSKGNLYKPPYCSKPTASKLRQSSQNPSEKIPSKCLPARRGNPHWKSHRFLIFFFIICLHPKWLAKIVVCKHLFLGIFIENQLSTTDQQTVLQFEIRTNLKNLSSFFFVTMQFRTFFVTNEWQSAVWSDCVLPFLIRHAQ